MPRAPFQVLVFPYRRTTAGTLEYAIFQRADLGVWQGIAGGGEDDETPEATAMREANEEAGIPMEAALTRLTTVASISVDHFRDRASWDPALRTIPEYAFGVRANGAARVT